MASVKEPARVPARVSHGPVVLAAVINGVSLAKIAESTGISLRRAEAQLRSELRKRWVAPAQDYARLQIARLDVIANQLKEKLKDRLKDSDLPTIDRLLRVMDRLDRYHGFTKLGGLSQSSREDTRNALSTRITQTTRQPARDK